MLSRRRFNYPPITAKRRVYIEGSHRYYRIHARITYQINDEQYEASINEVRTFDCSKNKDGPNVEELEQWAKAYLQHTYIDNPHWTLNVQANLSSTRAKDLLLNVQFTVEPELARVLDFSRWQGKRDGLAR